MNILDSMLKDAAKNFEPQMNEVVIFIKNIQMMLTEIRDNQITAVSDRQRIHERTDDIITNQIQISENQLSAAGERTLINERLLVLSESLREIERHVLLDMDEPPETDTSGELNFEL